MIPKNEVEQGFLTWRGRLPDRIEPLPASGGDRKYFRIWFEEEVLIGTSSTDILENNQYFYLTKLLSKVGLNVAEIYWINAEKNIYFQQDAGHESLLDRLSSSSEKNTNDWLKQVLRKLVEFQHISDQHVDYARLQNHHFGMSAALYDLNYFNYYFLKPAKIPYDTLSLKMEFYKLAALVSRCKYLTFMYRDFQSRNIMISESQLTFIDYQGGRKGPGVYDAISLLWQAKLNLDLYAKMELKQWYLAQNEAKGVDPKWIEADFAPVLIVRLLQVLGAYGRRGWKEKKPHFMQSIAPAIDNLSFVSEACEQLSLAYLAKLLRKIIAQKQNILWEKID